MDTIYFVVYKILSTISDTFVLPEIDIKSGIFDVDTKITTQPLLENLQNQIIAELVIKGYKNPIVIILTLQEIIPNPM